MERAARIWFLISLALFVTAVWWCEVFPSQDGPAHVMNAMLLRGPLPDVYEFQRGLTTNWTAHLLLVPLLGVMTPEAADKTVVTLALLVCAAGALLCLRRAAWLLPFALPLFLNGLLFAGFYSFVFGLGFLLLVAAGARWRWLWLLLAWISHPFTWAAALAVAIAQDPRSWRRLLVESSPGLTCAVWFALHAGGGGLASPPLLAGRWRDFLFAENPFAVVHPAFALASAALMAALCALAVYAWRRGPRDGLLLLAGLCWLAWPLAPKQTFTGNLVPRRVLLCALIFTLLWVSRQSWSQPLKRRAWAAGAAFATSMVLVAAWQMAAVQPLLAEYRAFRVQGTTLALRYELEPSMMRGVDVFLHAADWMIARDGALAADNYEARTAHFPLRYRRPPVEGLINTSAAPPAFDLRASSLPDTILLWRYPAADALRETLKTNFVLAQRGARGELWRRRASTSTP